MPFTLEAAKATMFRAKSDRAVEAVSAKISAAEASVRDIEATIQRDSVALVLADDQATLAMLRAKLADANAHLATCRMAMDAATKAEGERQAAARIQVEKSRQREIGKKIGKVVEEAAALRQSIGEAVEHYKALMLRANEITRMLRAEETDLRGALTPKKLHEMVTAEISRVGLIGNVDGTGRAFGEASFPGATIQGHGPMPNGTTVRDFAPLDDRLKERLEGGLSLIRGDRPPVDPATIIRHDPIAEREARERAEHAAAAEQQAREFAASRGGFR